MRQFLLGVLAPVLFACTQSAFLLVRIELPAETSAPAFDEIEVEVNALVDGVDITKRVVFRNDDQRVLPASFVLEFPGDRNKFPVTISVAGIADGVEIFSAKGNAIIGEEISIFAEFCGDGVTQTSRNENCDDANTIDGDGCDSNCTTTSCGNGILSPDEECEDGNTIDDDGCDADCTGIDIVQLAAGGEHTCALLDIGTVRCWGSNEFGQLGYANSNNIGDDEIPNSIGDVNVGAKIVQITTGESHTCALTVEGKVRCWGKNDLGQLGYGNLNNIGDNEFPEQAGDLNLAGTVTQISSKFNHTCAIFTTGDVRCWGDDSGAQLGYNGSFNNVGDNETPASQNPVTLNGAALQISTGNLHTCAILNTENLRCWGNGSSGRLGYGNSNSVGDNETPAQAGFVNVGKTSQRIATGDLHTCTITKDLNVTCWGFGLLGQLGYGDIGEIVIGDDEVPATIGSVPLGAEVTEITAGIKHTCVLTTTGTIRCWGDGANGRLGYGDEMTIGDNETPDTKGDVPLGDLAVQVDAGGKHTCALLQSGTVRCWGLGSSGQLGYGNTDSIGDDEILSELPGVSILD